MIKALVSVIVVNYNGRHLLGDCLDSLLVTNFPSKKMEIIVVDNDSRDDSVSFIKKKYPDIKLIEAGGNLGFTGGNNLGLEHAQGEYIALINSDVRVTPDWLSELLKGIRGEKTGIASPRIYFDTPFLELVIESDTIRKSDLDGSADFTPLGVLMEDVRAEKNKMTNLIWYQSGFYKKRGKDVTTRWTSGRATILVPFLRNLEKETYNFTFHGFKNKKIDNNVKISLEGKALIQTKVGHDQVEQIRLTIPKKTAKKHFRQLIQNAGNVVLWDGKGKDRGSILRIKYKKAQEFYDHDYPYYSKSTKLLAFCGAACLIKRKMLKQIGFFDGHFFMYYEDMDLSLRAWKMGWNIKYIPTSIVFHKHKATTGTAPSEFFLNLVEQNHLAFVLTHFPLKIFVIQTYILFIRIVVSSIYAFVYQFSSDFNLQQEWETKAIARKKALQYIMSNFFRILKNRQFWQKRQKRSFEQMKKYLY